MSRAKPLTFHQAVLHLQLALLDVGLAIVTALGRDPRVARRLEKEIEAKNEVNEEIYREFGALLSREHSIRHALGEMDDSE